MMISPFEIDFPPLTPHEYSDNVQVRKNKVTFEFYFSFLFSFLFYFLFSPSCLPSFFFHSYLSISFLSLFLPLFFLSSFCSSFIFNKLLHQHGKKRIPSSLEFRLTLGRLSLYAVSLPSAPSNNDQVVLPLLLSRKTVP